MTTPQTIAPSITKAASQQTYYTIRFLADRERAPDAYRAYAYFRWVDDTLDAGSNSAQDRTYISRTAKVPAREMLSAPIDSRRNHGRKDAGRIGSA